MNNYRILIVFFELQLMIFSQLDATSVAHLSCVCKGIRSVCNDENLWNFFCRRDFGRCIFVSAKRFCNAYVIRLQM